MSTHVHTHVSPCNIVRQDLSLNLRLTDWLDWLKESTCPCFSTSTRVAGVWVYACICEYVHMCVCVCMQVCVWQCVYECMCICVCAGVCMCACACVPTSTFYVSAGNLNPGPHTSMAGPSTTEPSCSSPSCHFLQTGLTFKSCAHSTNNLVSLENYTPKKVSHSLSGKDILHLWKFPLAFSLFVDTWDTNTV